MVLQIFEFRASPAYPDTQLSPSWPYHQFLDVSSSTRLSHLSQAFLLAELSPEPPLQRLLSLVACFIIFSSDAA